jgi:signal transduction histidine kinase
MVFWFVGSFITTNDKFACMTDNNRSAIFASMPTMHEYQRLKQLIDAATAGKDISNYGGDSLIYVDPASNRIIDANAAVFYLLGYSTEMLIDAAISDLETIPPLSDSAKRTYIETSIEEQVYPATYHHCSGQQVAVQVSRRSALRDGASVICYRLQEMSSLCSQVWRELRRREDDGFQFQQKLKALNEVTIALSLIDSHDLLCRQTIQLGIEKLGFDRLSIWFLDAEHGVMTGCYGVDEHGQLRAEYDRQWEYDDTYITKFIEGATDGAIASDNAPLYNDKSEIIQYGTHIAAPVLHGNRFIGILMADNLLHNQPMNSYEPELLRQYGMTVGHLTELVRAREQAFALRLQEEHTEMLRQFITNVGHDFKTPLSSISLKSYLMLRAQSSEQKQSLSDGIQQQVTYITESIDRMLDFIEFEGKPGLAREQLNLASLVSVVVDAFRSRLDGKHIKCARPESGLTIEADARLLQRALSEILDNAIRYSPEAGQIDISLLGYADRVGIRVRDYAAGIDEAHREKIFMPLYRIDEARTERRSGLGLAIAKVIVEAHGGHISFDSAPGQGSTFEIILPA